MADESQNPFAKAATAAPRFAQPGTIFGTFDQLLGNPTQQEYEATERKGIRDEARSLAATEREALSDIVGLVNETRDQNPGAPSHMLMKQIIASPRFHKSALRVPAERMTKFVGEIISQIAAPEAPKPVVVGEGAALVNPQTGAPIFHNPKPAEADPRTKAEQAALAKRSIDQLGKISETGQAARMDELNIAELERLGDKIGTGGAAAIRGYFSRIGVDLGDASDINAFEALVDRLAPQMRQPGSGSSSDKDVALFKSALPSLIRTPEGNRQILSTLKAMNKHRLKEADIADQVFDGTLTVPQGLRELRKLPSPLAGFKDAQGGGKKPQTSFNAPVVIRRNPQTGKLEEVLE